MAVIVDIDEQKLMNSPGVIEWYQDFAKECLREAHALTAERVSGGSGGYQRSFTFELVPGNPPTLRFGNTSDIAIYVEEDTEPHIIEPRTKKALRWFEGPAGGGAGPANLHFARRVHHPGTTGKHIIRDAVTNAGARLRAT